jgi:hypothetical protein
MELLVDSVADPDPGSGAFWNPGSGIFLTWDPGSGIEKLGSGIWYKDLGSAALVVEKIFVGAY